MNYRFGLCALALLAACGGEPSESSSAADVATASPDATGAPDGMTYIDGSKDASDAQGETSDAVTPDSDVSGDAERPVEPPDCDASSPCVLSATPTGEGCDVVFAEAGAPCDDGDADTVEDSCDGQGICAGLLFDCEDDLVGKAQWFGWESQGALDGLFEFGQTHVTRAVEDRLAPPVSAERETLVLFTPDEPAGPGAVMRLSASLNGASLGVLEMSPPTQLPRPLEQELTQTQLEPYSEQAWSATLPWTWIRPGVSLRVGLEDGEKKRVAEHTLDDLGSPHHFTLTRTHMILFGEPDFEVVPPQPAAKVAADMAPWVPGAELRWVDTSPWRLSQVVVNTSEGPRWAQSEAERVEITTDGSRWNIIKHQGALRLSLANTGRGLRMTGASQGDSSPYSYGTSMVQGWVRLEDGSYADINNAGLAAGWTGWSGMWLNECGNGFIHEVGHTFTLAHFTNGTSESWGIADEYPLNGVNLGSHPWGYDSVRRRFRTWYRVNMNGPVMEDGALVGKRDPMNGGEASNQVSCYPQYTAYQMKRSQAWLETSPTLMAVDDVPGVYRWSPEEKSYLHEEPAQANQKPIAVDGPAVTLIGTLGNLDDVCQTYPPIHIPEGNVFEHPNPENPDLPGVFNGAQWFLQIDYADGSTERALIARAAIPLDDTSLSLYSLNLDATRKPTVVSLHRSASAYPAIDVDGAELIHVRQLDPMPKQPKPVLRVGRGQLPNDELRLNLLCDSEINCGPRSASATFSAPDGVVSFSPVAAKAAPALCSTHGDVSVWQIPVVSETGVETTVTAHAQRRISAPPHSVHVPAEDITNWLSADNARQSLSLWLPYGPNSDLPAGVYTTPSTFDVQVLRDGVVTETIAVRVSLNVREVETVTIPPNYMSDGVAIPEGDSNSSIYYVFEDPQIGPAGSKWWGSNVGNVIHVPVQDQETGDLATLVLRAHKVACGDWWEINTGQSADWGCTHSVHLALEPDANPGLLAGHTYVSPGSHPVVIKALRWHQPDAGQVLDVLALRVQHTAP